MQAHSFWYERRSQQPDGIKSSVLSTRIRMARNIAAVPFPSRMSLQQCLAMRSSVLNVVVPDGFIECGSRGGGGVQVSDFLVSYESRPSSIIAFGNPSTGQVVVVGDEDHLRISTVASGLLLAETFDATCVLERQLSASYQFAFDARRFGFLTASLANAGLAMRASVWMHLPGLALSGRWTDLEPLLVSMDISLRGIVGEESDMTAGMVQLSNRTSYGRTADELMSKLSRVVELVDAAERAAVSELLRQYRSQTIDFLKWMSMLEQPFMHRDAFVHAVSASLLASRLGYNVRFDTGLAIRVLIAGFKSLQQDGSVQMQVVRNLLRDTVIES